MLNRWTSTTVWIAIGLTLMLLGLVALIANLSERHIQQDSNCAAVSAGWKKWEQRTPVTAEELKQEINDVLVDNQCDGITPVKLRKVLNDLVEVP